MRPVWLVLLLSLPLPALGQQPPPPGQTRADQAIDGRLRLVTETLHDAATRLSRAEGPDLQEVRRAVDEAQAMLADLPAGAGQEVALNRARSALAEAHNAIEADTPDNTSAARELREAAEAMAALRPGLGTTMPQRR